MDNNNGKRVFKNTLSLYFRTIILTFVSLYTSRVVLSSLGVDDFGIQNVVGGFVSMFAFISGTLANATQRFFALDLARNDWNKTNLTYSINIIIYFLFIFIIIIIAETLGLWFLLNILNIDNTRLVAAVVVYECSIIGFIFSLFTSIYIALLIADENLSIYSAVSIIESFLKLGAVYLLTIITYDKLILYSIIITIVGVSTNMVLMLYCKHAYPSLKFKLCSDIDKYSSVFRFQGWNLIGASASVLKAQGINIVINIFFGTALNSARGIAMQVNTAINSFAANFMKAIDPQITKSYGEGNERRFKKLIIFSSKVTFALLFVITVPVVFDAEYILGLWLKEVPEYTVVFVRLALIDAIIYSVTDSICTGVQAIGKIKGYQIIVGGLLLLNVPLSYVMIKSTNNPVSAFYASIILSALATIGRLVSIRRIYLFDVGKYLIEVIAPIIVVTIITVIVIKWGAVPAKTVVELLRNAIAIIVFCSVEVITLILNKSERKMLINMIYSKIKN